MITFYDWWEQNKMDYPSSAIEYQDIENAAQAAWEDGYYQAMKRFGKLGGPCQDILDHNRIPGTNECCKCGFRFED